MVEALKLPPQGAFLGRLQRPDRPYPSVAVLRDGMLHDITSRVAPTVSDVCALANPAEHVRMCPGDPVGPLDAIAANSFAAERDASRPFLLSPVDLQAIKAAGVTFAASLIERVIEEQARGSAEKANAIRADIVALVGADLSNLKPGSAAAAELKSRLVAKGAWSQYLEVGIGPDAEIFTKCQPMSSVGYGADIGIRRGSHWNNPEPEIAVVAASSGRIVGATLGNDVNLRDVEGRSALLLGMAKDNNASAALGPFIRLFDATFSGADVANEVVGVAVEGEDGFSLRGASSMARISRSPQELVAAAMGPHHQYPDGMVLYLGTMFVPSDDRGEAGKGFTHRIGDMVSISSAALGILTNRVRHSDECPPWTYGAGRLMRDLAAAGFV
jgi:fumarylacetoacetate (FAA) hydrolase family protein